MTDSVGFSPEFPRSFPVNPFIEEAANLEASLRADVSNTETQMPDQALILPYETDVFEYFKVAPRTEPDGSEMSIPNASLFNVAEQTIPSQKPPEETLDLNVAITPEAIETSEHATAHENIGEAKGQTPDLLSLSASEENITVKRPNVIRRIGNTLVTFFKEMAEKGHRAKRFGAFVLGGGTQAAERGRVSAIFLPAAFDETLEHAFENGYNGYQTAGLAFGVVGGLFGLWEYGVGKAFQQAVDVYPKTTATFTENHPATVEAVAKAIDGFPSAEELAEAQPIKPEEGYDVSPYMTAKSMLGKVALGANRSWRTAFMFGTTAHSGISTVKEHSKKSRERRLLATTAEAGLFMGSVAVGVSAMVINDYLGWAERTRSIISNEKLWMIVSVGFVAAAAALNYSARRSAMKDLKLQTAKETV